MLCDAATIRENLLHVLGGGVTHVIRPSFPAPLGCTLALSFYVKYGGGTDVVHKVDVTGYKVGVSEPIFQYTTEFAIAEEPPAGAESVGLAIPLDNIGLPEPGDYEIAVGVNDEQLTVIPFTAALPPLA